MSLLTAGGWTRWPLKVPSNSNYSKLSGHTLKILIQNPSNKKFRSRAMTSTLYLTFIGSEIIKTKYENIFKKRNISYRKDFSLEVTS